MRAVRTASGAADLRGVGRPLVAVIRAGSVGRSPSCRRMPRAGTRLSDAAGTFSIVMRKPRAAATSASVPSVGLTRPEPKSRRITAGSDPTARARSALERPSATRASSSAFTTASIVAIRADSMAYWRAKVGCSRSLREVVPEGASLMTGHRASTASYVTYMLRRDGRTVHPRLPYDGSAFTIATMPTLCRRSYQ